MLRGGVILPAKKFDAIQWILVSNFEFYRSIESKTLSNNRSNLQFSNSSLLIFRNLVVNLFKRQYQLIYPKKL